MTNYRNQHINPFITLLLGGLLFLLGACDSSIDEPVAEGSLSNYRVKLYISLTGSQTRGLSTRAPWDTEGDGFENYLDLSDFRVYLFNTGDNDNEGKLLAHLTDPKIKKDVEFKIERTVNNNIYAISFRVDLILDDAKTALQNFKIVMLANWGHKYPDVKIGETTINNLTNHDNCIADFTPGESIAKIPFFGVQEYSDVQLNSGNVTTLEESVHLLRAFAKIEVYDDPKTDLRITGVKLKHYNKKFYKAPLHTTESSYKDKAPALSLVDDYETTSEDDGAIEITPDSRGHYIIYVPEYKNIGREDNNKSYLLVSYEDQDFTVDFKYYQNPPAGFNVDDRYDLHRNYWYEIIVKRTVKLEVTVEVQPYSNVELLPQFGLERTEDGYIIVRNSKGEIIKFIRPNGDTLTFEEDNSWPYLGKFMGVFDSTKRVLVGYFEDGRSIIFNYSSNDFDPGDKLKNLDSWEIYSSPTLKDSNGKLIPEYLQETFCFIDYFYDEGYEDDEIDPVIIKHKFTHTVLDQKGRVIEEYLYATLQDFQNHKENQATYTRTKLAEYEGDQYGDKVITYYKEDGTVICKLSVVGETESYNYGPF